MKRCRWNGPGCLFIGGEPVYPGQEFDGDKVPSLPAYLERPEGNPRATLLEKPTPVPPAPVHVPVAPPIPAAPITRPVEVPASVREGPRPAILPPLPTPDLGASAKPAAKGSRRKAKK